MQKLYDTKNLLDTHQGDEEFIKHIAGLFVQHMPVMLAELNKAFSSKDWQNMYFYSHKMKASIDLFAISELTETIRAVEQQAKAGVPCDNLGELVGDVDRIIAECVEQMRGEFEIPIE